MSYVKQVNHVPEPDYTQPIEFLALGLFQDKGLQESHKPVDRALGGLVSRVLERKDFKGKKGDRLILHNDGPLARVALVGLGEEEKFSTDVARQAAGWAVSLARKHNLAGCGLLDFEADLPEDGLTQALAEGLILGSYQFTDHKQPEADARELESLALYGPFS